MRRNVVLVTPGQAGDISHVQELLAQVRRTHVVADTAYDANHPRQSLRARRIGAVIPSNSVRQRKYPLNAERYRHRNLIERWFCRIKHFRRVATLYDKLVSRFASFIALAASAGWLA